MTTLRLSLVALVGLWGTVVAAAETFRLADDAASGKTYAVSATVSGEGTFRFQPSSPDAAPLELPVTIAATFEYAERRLPAAGRDDAAYRAFRAYELVDSRIRVGQQSSTPMLREDRERVVARATRQGVQSYATDGPLTAGEVELLPYPGESLLLAALLPGRAVAVGETWSPDPWVPPALAGTEVAFNHKLTCRLEAVRDGVATVTFDGQVEGAVKGATSKTTLKGTFDYELASGSISKAELTQGEDRAIGPLSPGMKLALKTTLTREPAPAGQEISDQEVAAVPSEPPADLLRVEHGTPFGVSLTCGRDWRVFHQTGEILILRLLDGGGLVAQCNVAAGPTVPAGQRTPGKLFGDAVRKSLGERFTKIVSTEELKTTDGLDVYRVIVTGKAKEPEKSDADAPANAEAEGSDAKAPAREPSLDRVWSYYLVTAPDGRQAELVFTTEPEAARRLSDRDFELVSSLRFAGPAAPRAAQK